MLARLQSYMRRGEKQLIGSCHITCVCTFNRHELWKPAARYWREAMCSCRLRSLHGFVEHGHGHCSTNYAILNPKP